MSATHPPEHYTNVVHEAEVDGGWSGQLRIVVGTNRVDQDALVFVDSELLGPRRLVLTGEETVALATALQAAGAEIMPPRSSVLRAFKSTFGYPAPPEHSHTAADLDRHVKVLSDQHDERQSALSAVESTLK